MYWESARGAAAAAGHPVPEVSLPVAFTVFPGEIFQAPRSWAEQVYPNLIYFHEAGKAHFAAWEEPDLFVTETPGGVQITAPAAITGADLVTATSGLCPLKLVRSCDKGDPHELIFGRLPTPAGPGSVSRAPNLPAGFTDMFTSRYVDTGDLRQHALTGGEGPPLLLVHGWPQTWYAWRMLMPALARDFSVIAVDQRGIGLSGKLSGGYDTCTLASDLVALMDALGHPRFAMYGTDVGMPIAYALAITRRVSTGWPSPRPPAGDISLPAAVPPPAAQRAALASGFQPAPQDQRTARHRARRHLLRRGVRRLGRDDKLPDYAVRYDIDTKLPPTPTTCAAALSPPRDPHHHAQNEKRKDGG